MKIVQINTVDTRGGAARAAYRLHKGFIQSAQKADMMVLRKYSHNMRVCQAGMEEEEGVKKIRFPFDLIEEQLIKKNRTPLSNTLFSLPYPGYDLSATPLIQDADIINLHWVSHYLSTVTLKKLLDLGKPLVWTLHDQWALTGGCHYSAGCEGYKKECRHCPQLMSDPYRLAEAVLMDKLALLPAANLTFVTPSRWLADCVRASRLFNASRVECIPYGLETDTFSPMNKRDAKEALGIPGDAVTLLFGAANGNERRKGFDELLQAIDYCKSDAAFSERVKKKELHILTFGKVSDEIGSLKIPVRQLGHLTDDRKICEAYSAAEIFILPSLEDNLPNTMLEAMSCATPVVAFDVGGIPDRVTEGETGLLAEAGNARRLGQAILDLTMNEEKRRHMGLRGRELMEGENTLQRQANQYIALFSELLAEGKGARKAAVAESAGQASAVERGGAMLDPGMGPAFSRIYGPCYEEAVYRLKAERDRLRTGMTDMQGSYSWRLTQPLRGLKKLFDKAR